jgi:putative membrane protein
VEYRWSSTRGLCGHHAFEQGQAKWEAAMMGNGSGGAGMWLFGLLLLIGIAILVFVAVRVLAGGVSRVPATPGTDVTQPRNHAGEILDERYARGEIDTDEYLNRVRHLRDGNA